MCSKRRAWTILTVLALILGSPWNNSEAQRRLTLALAPNVSTLGVGGDVVMGVSRRIAVRAGGHWARLRPSFSDQDVAYNVTLEWKSAQLLVDFHPWGNAVRVSGGAIWNGNQLDVIATAARAVTMSGRLYQPHEIGSLSGTVNFNQAAPYVGVGVRGLGRVGFSFDVGVAVQGKPRQRYSTITTLTGTDRAMFDQVAQDETDSFGATVDHAAYLRVYPVLSVGMSLRVR